LCIIWLKYEVTYTRHSEEKALDTVEPSTAASCT